jgi:trichothecene 3-O-acetyltransferase
MAAIRETRVEPRSSKKGEVVRLSDLGVIEPKLYVHMIEVFSLQPDADKQQILNNLSEGLSRTFAEYPILVGSLHFENEAKRIAVQRTAASSVTLAIKEPGPDGAIDVESFATLDKHDFPVHLLDASKVLPSSVVGTFPIPAPDLSTDGPAVCAFQVTFIDGGIILALAITHQVSDGMGCETLLTSWSRNSYAVSNGEAHRALDPATMPGRNILSGKGKPITSAEELRKLGDKFPTYKARDGPPAPPPADFKMPAVKTRIWHVPKSKLKDLKDLTSEPALAGRKGKGEGKDWVSTYDALLAILWRAIVRAKQPLLKPDPAAPSRAIHAVNTRGRTEPAIPDNYIGVAVTLPQSHELTVTDVLSPDLGSTLPLLAHAVRAATKQVTPSYVADLIRWAGSCHDLRWVELDMHWVLGLDCMAFDWHTMKSYQVHDFGFGKPAALRWPHPQFEDLFFVLPTRTTKSNPDEGLEICLGLEESCYPNLETDEEFLRFAEERGKDV